MKSKISFEDKILSQILGPNLNLKKRKIINFLNLHDLYQISMNNNFLKILTSDNSINFIDGFTISGFLSLRNFKRVKRVRGPTFTREILMNKRISKNKKHFFIGFENQDLLKLKKTISHLKKVKAYNPPYIKGTRFPKKEIEKISKMINKYKPHFVWVGIGCPKQNLLAEQLFKNTKTDYFFNVGAALDFLLGKKKEAPKIVRELGIEWFYRLITDFNYSKKKVWRSFIGLSNLNKVELIR